MSTTAGGDSTVTRFTLGTSPGAMINGTEFGDLSQFGPQLGLAGTMRFDAPVLVLPPLESFRSSSAPFVFTAQVMGFALDDVDARTPLFTVALVGQGTALLEFFDLRNGSLFEPYVTYTFAAAPAPVPEPGTLLLVATALAGLAAGRRQRRSHRAVPLICAVAPRPSAP
jgi:hypothetical protein